MANGTIPFYAHLDLRLNQLKNAKLEVLAADPTGTGLVAGRTWYNSTDKSFNMAYLDGTDVKVLKYYAGQYIPETARGAASGVATLDSTGKLTTSQIPESLVGGLVYKGTFDASKGDSSITPAKGWYYICNVAGSKNPDSSDAAAAYTVGDWAIYSGEAWQKIDAQESVTSVNGRIGAVEVYQGAWTTSTAYKKGDVVSDTNGYMFICTEDHTAGAAIDRTKFAGVTISQGNGITVSVADKVATIALKVADTGANGLSVDSDGLKLGLASADANGAMSSSDFTKLAGISTGANKVEASTTNGNIKIDGTETTVYTHPTEKYTELNAALTAASGLCTWAVTHGLGTKDVIVQVYTAADGQQIFADIARTGDNAVTIYLASDVDIAKDTFKVVITKA